MDTTGYPDQGADGCAQCMRRFRQGDLRVFERFWNAQAGEAFASERARAFHRLLSGNPFSSTRDDYLVLVLDGRVVAYEGLMPFRFSVSGRDVDGFIYHDTMVAPEMRGKGVGRAFVQAILQNRPEFSLAVWMNAANSHVFGKCGWLPVENLPTYVRGYSLRNMVKTRYRLINAAVEQSAGKVLSLLYRLEKKAFDFSGRGYRIELTDGFDERIDELFHAVKHEFAFIAHRNGAILNWKFADSPSARFVRLICVKGDNVQAYLVFRTRRAQDGRRISTIFDFLCSPRDADLFRALMRRAVLEIEKTGPDTLEVLCTDRRFARVLKTMGFVHARENPGALKYIHSGAAGRPAGIGKGENWFYTFGDGDKVFWDV